MDDKHILRLKERGFKLTPKRLQILRIFQGSRRFMSPEEIFKAISGKFRRASFPSVYRNLETLCDAGILAKVSRPDRRLYYALCGEKKGRHHHHIVCTECGKIGELLECGLSGRKTIAGFTITGHFIQLEGICSECRKT